jgi:hypothetical protein
VEHRLARAATAALTLDREHAVGELRTAFEALAKCGACVSALEVCTALLSLRPRDARRLRAIGRELVLDDRAAQVAWRGRHRLRVEMLGTAEVRVDGRQVRFTTKQCEDAFFVLCAQPTCTINVEVLGDLLWPWATGDRIAQRLSTLVWQMRFCLGGAGERVRRHRNILTLDLDDDECDFREAMNGFAPPSREVPRDLRLDEAPLLPRFAQKEWLVSLQRRIDVGRPVAVACHE